MSELTELEILLDRVLPNPMGFVERVVEQLLDRLASAPVDGATVVSGTVLGGPAARPDARLSERNFVLAAALGACTCWGEDAACAFCDGQGSAAWMSPDPELFDVYVRPAVDRMTADQMATASAADARQRRDPGVEKETSDD